MVLDCSLTVLGGFSPFSLICPQAPAFCLTLYSLVGIDLLMRVSSFSAFNEISNHQHLFFAHFTQSGGERSEDNSVVSSG